MFAFLAGALFLTGSGVFAQDPATGWMAYAVGAIPSKYERITRLEMSWKVSDSPSRNNAFYSPWFGMDPSDNDNLLQPVNPWTGGGWEMYTEYYQWSPSRNSNSQEHTVQAGQTLHGAIVYSGSESYEITQTIEETGATSKQTVQCQSDKKFTIPYVVYEKTWSCSAYPPDGKVTFQILKAECDGNDCRNDIKWEAKVKDPNCDMTAHIESQSQISITWDTSAASKYDSYTDAQLKALNGHGWGARFVPHNSTVVV